MVPTYISHIHIPALNEACSADTILYRLQDFGTVRVDDAYVVPRWSCKKDRPVQVLNVSDMQPTEEVVTLKNLVGRKNIFHRKKELRTARLHLDQICFVLEQLQERYTVLKIPLVFPVFCLNEDGKNGVGTFWFREGNMSLNTDGALNEAGTSLYCHLIF